MAIPSPGEVLLGKYRVERVLGQGGMGVVVAATHIGLDDRVAIKFLLPEATRHPDIVARFSREARAAAKIKGEHVCRVIDVGATDAGAPYMVMEHLDGRDLAQALHERGPLPIPEAVDCVLQACEALAEAHALGIVHRDLKPANLFVVRRPDGSPCVKVLDFGISKAALRGDEGNADAALTATSAVMGSPLYMSPEQLRSARSVDARADVWSLGVVLHELLTGRTPFDAESVALLCVAILQEEPKSPCALRPDIPEGLAAIVLRALAKDREARIANVSELANALVPFGGERAPLSAANIASVLGLARRAPTSAPPSAFAETVATATTGLSAASTLASGSTARSKGPLVFGIAVAAVILGGGALALSRHAAPAMQVAPAPIASTVAEPSPPRDEKKTEEPRVVVTPVASASTPPPTSASAPPPTHPTKVAPQAQPPAPKTSPPPKKNEPDIGY